MGEEQWINPPPYPRAGDYVRHGNPSPLPGVTFCRDSWFTICKFYIAIKNGVALGAALLLAGLLLIVAIMGLFRNNFAITIFMILIVVLLGLLATYLYMVAVQGALQERPKRLIIHGVVEVLFFIGALSMIPTSSSRGDSSSSSSSSSSPKLDPEVQRVYDISHSPSSIISTLLFCGLDLVACFLMAVFLNKEQQARVEDSYGI